MHNDQYSESLFFYQYQPTVKLDDYHIRLAIINHYEVSGLQIGLAANSLPWPPLANQATANKSVLLGLIDNELTVIHY